jgi:hypothetical protein
MGAMVKSDFEKVRSQTLEQNTWDAAVAAFVQWLIGVLANSISWLAIPGIGPIIGLIVTPIIQKLFDLLLQWFNFNIIDAVVSNEVTVYNQAKDLLAQVISNPQSTNADIEKAKNDFQKVFVSLIHLSM